MVQLTYRYASPEYIQVTLPNYATREQYKDGISQVGGAASWPIADRWSIVGAYYFDTNANKPADQMVGLQYNSCCYALRVGYERKLNGWDTQNNQSKYDNVIGFNVELRGLSSNYGRARSRCCARTFCRTAVPCNVLVLQRNPLCG